MYELDALLLAPAVPDLLAQAVKLDIAPGPGGSRMSSDKETRFYLEPVLREHWPELGPITYITVIALYPSSQLVGHCDAPIHATRYHIPLQQNVGCWSFHDGHWQQLQIGRAYTMDPSLFHGAVNWGSTVRLHLIVDVC